jgi:uncharacterized protein (UPF0147 family)
MMNPNDRGPPMQKDIPPESHEIARIIRESIKKPKYTFHELVAFVSKVKGKPIVILEVLIHHGYLGLCFSFRNCYLVLVVPGMSKILALSTRIHELIHVYRDDVEQIDQDYDESMKEIITDHAMMRKEADGTYKDLTEEEKKIEDIVEGTALIILDDIEEDDDVPPMVRMMYRDRG